MSIQNIPHTLRHTFLMNNFPPHIPIMAYIFCFHCIHTYLHASYLYSNAGSSRELYILLLSPIIYVSFTVILKHFVLVSSLLKTLCKSSNDSAITSSSANVNPLTFTVPRSTRSSSKGAILKNVST